MIRNDEGPRQDTCRGPCGLPRRSKERTLQDALREVCVLNSVTRARDLAPDYRAATLFFFFLAGAAAAPFGAGHGAW